MHYRMAGAVALQSSVPDAVSAVRAAAAARGAVPARAAQARLKVTYRLNHLVDITAPYLAQLVAQFIKLRHNRATAQANCATPQCRPPIPSLKASGTPLAG
ncbi:protein of unknown function (plasmid) [Cupriavidus taiwanensis]|uniref:Uncharacterized protein n=1 Tax=Cupriavidus taiwanensis TaxID=164546 RepID=A0A9Q7V156_9BURK|nr:protein of unknown function [Cupriavidus taiwanensis]